jgi:hypothetical protein
MSTRAALLSQYGAEVGPATLAGLSWGEVLRRFVRWAECRAAADPGFRALWRQARHEEDADLARRGWRPVFCLAPRGGVGRFWCRLRAAGEGGGQTGAVFRHN